ncbi:MAG TPA: hypothetical protein VKR59_12425 [Terriglobales bacterium]|nr:hypothetical protein [Terriglobales bacterium]
MKKIFLAMLLVAAVTAVAQTPAAPAQAAPQPNPAPAAAPAAQKKEIKDPAEYNAYVGAVQQTDPAAKVSGLEAFLTQYPNSVMKEDALELLMGAYQATNNQPKTIETAQKVLAANACNIRALALLAYANQSQQKFADAGQSGDKGLQCLQTATKPFGTSDADWDKLKAQTTVIFDGAAGLAAYQATATQPAGQPKDFAKAEKLLRAAVEADPDNLLDVYDLALGYLTPGPAEDDVNGLFFIARASNLAQGAGKAQIAKFGLSKYTKYHGSDEGWNDLLASTATTKLPPAGFTIKKYVPPTPAEQAADLVKSKKVEEMSFAEWQLVLSEGTPEDSEKVWTVLKGKPLQMVGHVISIDTTDKTTTKLMLAGSSDDIDAKRADIDLTMGAVIPKASMPAVDADFQFQGTPVSFVAKPFVMTMNDGALLVTSKPKPKPPVHKKPAQ